MSDHIHPVVSIIVDDAIGRGFMPGDSVFGAVPCPACNRCVSYSIGVNGNCHGKCQKDGCLNVQACIETWKQ